MALAIPPSDSGPAPTQETVSALMPMISTLTEATNDLYAKIAASTTDGAVAVVQAGAALKRQMFRKLALQVSSLDRKARNLPETTGLPLGTGGLLPSFNSPLDGGIYIPERGGVTGYHPAAPAAPGTPIGGPGGPTPAVTGSTPVSGFGTLGAMPTFGDGVSVAPVAGGSAGAPAGGTGGGALPSMPPAASPPVSPVVTIPELPLAGGGVEGAPIGDGAPSVSCCPVPADLLPGTSFLFGSFSQEYRDAVNTFVGLPAPVPGQTIADAWGQFMQDTFADEGYAWAPIRRWEYSGGV